VDAMANSGAAAGLRERLRIRAGGFKGSTAGLAPGNVQANLVILPRDLAQDFLHFTVANPKPCPLLAVSRAGDPHLPTLAEDVDIRTDLPRYRIWRNGELTDEASDLMSLWRDDFVSFAIGCSFSFEEALVDGGLEIRHLACGSNVPMYRTNRACVPAGVFRGPLVVSMRPFTPADAIRAIQITSRFPTVHGAPVHIGLPEALGIADLAKPDYGDAVPVHAGELPVFWACGVTPQAVVVETKPDICVTHAPGCMLITDLRNAQLAML
jgi:uncharacterized protein YcsI (UPF0317 family)